MHALLLACASLLCADPHGDAPSAQRCPGVAPLAVHLEETRLVAVNRSLEPFVLVLASPGRRNLVARTVAPGATVVASHPPRALTGLWLEVLCAPDGRLATSGGLALDGRAQTLHFGPREETSMAGGLPVHAERDLARGPSFLPEHAAPTQVPPLHVPIPAPKDKPPGDTPPPVEKEPLPPV